METLMAVVNPEMLGEDGITLLLDLKKPWHMWWAGGGEPTALPAAYYQEEHSPRGMMLLGWRLTEAGMAAWEVARG